MQIPNHQLAVNLQVSRSSTYNSDFQMPSRTRTNAQSSILLSRSGTRPLLRTVNGTRHASDDDHGNASPTETNGTVANQQFQQKKRRVEEDPHASPISSDEEEGNDVNDVDELHRDSPTFNPKMNSLHSRAGISSSDPSNGKSKRKRGGGEIAVAAGTPASQPTVMLDSMFDAHCTTVSRQRTSGKWTCYSGKPTSRPHGRTFMQSPVSSTSTRQTRGPVGAKDKPASRFKKPTLDGLKDASAPEVNSMQFKSPSLPNAKRRGRLLRSQSSLGYGNNDDDDAKSEVKLPGTGSFKMPPKLKHNISIITPPPSNDTEALRSVRSTSSNLSTPLSSPTLDALQFNSDALFDQPERHTYKCPMCQTLIPPGMQLLRTEQKERMTMREQAAFCRRHKRFSAEKTWKERGYPEIDWDSLDDRLRNFHGQLSSLLSGKSQSRLRSALEEGLGSGRQRTLRQVLGSRTEQLLVPGYYGARGARVL